jgi:hypothetical protein
MVQKLYELLQQVRNKTIRSADGDKKDYYNNGELMQLAEAFMFNFMSYSDDDILRTADHLRKEIIRELNKTNITNPDNLEKSLDEKD